MKKLILLSIFSILVYFGYSQSKPSLHSLNPAFTKYQNNLQSGKLILQTIDGHKLGYIPPSVRPQYSHFYNTKNLLKSDKSLPATYDLRTLGYVSPVKDQGQCGDCWAFASYGAVESRWLMLGNGANILSENNLKDCSGFQWGPCDGGNSILSTAYLSRLSGPASATADPYNQYPAACIDTITPLAYVTDARFVPDDMNTIKLSIIDYGAMYVAFYYADQYYNSGNYTYYCNDTTQYANHAVTLIGWNDNITTAGGKGAWLLKNSWGASWGDNGYFYISYNDVLVLSENTYFPAKVNYMPSSRVYYYDYLGWDNDWGYNDTIAYAVVKYVASDNNPLYKIGTWINTAGAVVNISVYSAFNGNTLSGLLDSIPTQTCTFPGYYTFSLPAPVSLISGNTFYIKVRYYTPGYNSPIPVEQALSAYANPTIESGKCWSSHDGIKWDALGSNTFNPMNLCINAYSYSNCTPPPANIASSGQTSFCSGQNVSLTSNSGSQYFYQWLHNNIPIDGATNSSFVAHATGDYNVVVTRKNGCSKTSPVVSAPYAISAGNNFSINCNDSAQIIPTVNYPTGNYIKVYGPKTLTFTNIGLANFGSPITGSFIQGNIIYTKDNDGSYLGCSALGYVPGSFYNKIALIDRGTCYFSSKAYAAQQAGAIAIIIANNQANGSVLGMSAVSDSALINIPVLMVSYEAGDSIKSLISTYGSVNASLGFDATKLKFSWSPPAGLSAANIFSPIAKPKVKTTYNFTVTNDSCTVSASVTINIADAPVINLGQDISVNNDTIITLHAGSGYKSYKWNNKSAQSALIINTDSLSVGTHIYSVIATDSNGCMGIDSIKINIFTATPVYEIHNCQLSIVNCQFIKIYPNPTNGLLNIHFTGSSSQPYDVTVYNSLGSFVEYIKTAPHQANLKLDLSKYSDGIYLIKIAQADKLFTQKIIKK